MIQLGVPPRFLDLAEYRSEHDSGANISLNRDGKCPVNNRIYKKTIFYPATDEVFAAHFVRNNG